MIKLILADDETFTLNSLAELIDWESMGFCITALCSNGLEVLEHMEKEPADLIITDIKMPVMDGIELSQQCYNLYPDTQIILLSAYRDFEIARDALKYNVKNYILKPVSYSVLYETISKFSLDFEDNSIMSFEENQNLFTKQLILAEMNESVLTNINEIKKRISDTDWSFSQFCSGCAVFKITIENLNEYLSHKRHHNAHNIYTAVSSLLFVSSKSLEYIILKYHVNIFEVLVLKKDPDINFEEEAHRHILKLGELFDDILKIKVKITAPVFYNSVLEFAKIEDCTVAFEGIMDNKVMDNKIINEAINYIQKNYQTATLSNTANAICLSAAYFSVYFKKHVGKSFVSVVNEIRVNKAKELLADPSVKPSLVYQLVGYNSQSYFNKLFVSLVHSTPAQYQKKLLER